MKKTAGALILLLCLAPAVAGAKQVSLPVTLDYPVLKSLLLKQVFTEKGATALALDEDDGCRKIILSRPDIGPAGDGIRVGAHVYVHVGTSLYGRCVMPIEWEGYIETVQQVSLSKSGWRVNFKTTQSRLMEADRSPALIKGFIWNLIKTHVHESLDTFTVDLGYPVSELKSFLKALIPAPFAAAGGKVVQSMRPGPINVGPGAVRAQLIVDVDMSDEKAPAGPREEDLTKEELDKFTRTWESWDSYLVSQINTLGDKKLTESERQVLLEVLLDTRHGFLDHLAGKDSETDFVRKQFIEAWGKIYPIMRKRPFDSIEIFLAFVTAADALAVLDKAGPSMGLEVSRNGLLRLARLMNEGKSAALEYNYEVDGHLRKSLGLGPGRETPGPEIETEELDLENLYGPGEDIVSYLFSGLFSKNAWAAKPKKSPIDYKEIRQWISPKKNSQRYLQRAKALMLGAAGAALAKGGLDSGRHDLFRNIILGSAWQESCFRQYKMRRGKVTYIRSYDSSSVGIMQINERVWRGIYSHSSLRWNIKYNADAGSQIARIYLRKYAMKKMNRKKPLDDDTLARVVYAMYNGGPGQYLKFLKRHRKGKYYLSDRLFWEKFQWVKQGRIHNARSCL